MFVLGFIVLALLFGYLQGGSISAFSQLRLRHGALVAVALAIQVALVAWAPPAQGALAVAALVAHALSYLCVVAFMLANRHIGGAQVLAAGLFFNLLAIAARSGCVLQPMASAAAEAASAGAQPAPVFWYLGDILSMPETIPFAGAFSVGDILVGLGIFTAMREAMRPACADIQLLKPRYQPKHLARPGRSSSSARRAG